MKRVIVGLLPLAALAMAGCASTRPYSTCDTPKCGDPVEIQVK